ncbi:App1 family protein [Desertivibrio insolitus]|uniref:App1 family protein n=1 Tax=Herbiconiux sp. SYSU D00978 TaxID=2812562 RepID=UPI001F60D527|nr:phosphatase domain-containing protein [Herbiconiux sp. SYSU D00978]
MNRGKTGVAAAETELMHRAARMEDAFHEFREKRARRRGLTSTVIPYTGYGAPGWVRVLARVLLTKPEPAKSERSRYENIRGWRSFTSVPVNDVDVIVRIGDAEHTVRADRGGVVDARLEADLSPGWHEIHVRTDESDWVLAKVVVTDPAVDFGVISDIDDTVMVTALPRPFLAAWNTFVLDEHARRAVAGMAVLYERLTREHDGTPVIYLSTGAWNVAPTLSRFLGRNLYPAGPLLLTDWGPTHDRIFRSGKLHKKETLERIAQEFPEMRWLLVGDDGQHDEELYGAFVRSHPQNVVAVAIRQLSTSEAVLAGGRSRGEEQSRTSNIPWIYAPDGAGLSDQLEELGLLGNRPSETS